MINKFENYFPLIGVFLRNTSRSKEGRGVNEVGSNWFHSKNHWGSKSPAKKILKQLRQKNVVTLR